jgi:hypothetical protein
MAPFPQNAGGYPKGYPRTAGRVSFQLARYMYLVNRKGFLPVDEVASFQLTRYMYLVNWKDFLPAGPLPTL